MLRSVRAVLAATLLLAPLGAMTACAGLRDGPAPVTAPAPSPLGPAENEPAAEVVAAVGIPTAELRGKKIPKMGEVVVDADGFVLYRFDKDTAEPPASNCSGDCAAVWPPVLVDENLKLTGLDAKLVGTIEREDGATQVTLNGWPLYRYIGDKKAGQWKGQAVGGVWFVVAPTGKKNLSCLPTATPVPVPPPGADASPDAGASPAAAASPSGDGGYTY
jgi:predicted lipoprotein with Yx(FWY)xxD motif